MFKLFKNRNNDNKIKYEVKSYTYIDEDDVVYTPIWENDAINIVHDACVICVDGQKERDLKERAEFISGKVRMGHESILEHTNYIVKFTMDREIGLTEFGFMSQCFKYLNVKTKIVDDTFTLLIGGSVRGFKHIIRTNVYPNNILYKAILEYITTVMPSCFFSDLINDNIFSKNDFIDLYNDDSDNTAYKLHDYRKDVDWDTESHGELLYIDDLEVIYNRLNGEFTYYDLMDFACMNVIFVNVSRSCSHQLVRHRNGITQLSQRYVNMNNAMNIYPNALDLEEVCENPWSDGCKNYVPVEEVVDAVYDYYKQLVEKGVKKEDARYILPNCCATTLYMTFTFRNFIKAYKLRVDKHAQKEIRECFDKMFNKYNMDKYILQEEKITNVLDYVEPRYKFEEILHDKDVYDVDVDFDELDNMNKE